MHYGLDCGMHYGLHCGLSYGLHCGLSYGLDCGMSRELVSVCLVGISVSECRCVWSRLLVLVHLVRISLASFIFTII